NRRRSRQSAFRQNLLESQARLKPGVVVEGYVPGVARKLRDNLAHDLPRVLLLLNQPDLIDPGFAVALALLVGAAHARREDGDPAVTGDIGAAGPVAVGVLVGAMFEMPADPGQIEEVGAAARQKQQFD